MSRNSKGGVIIRIGVAVAIICALSLLGDMFRKQQARQKQRDDIPVYTVTQGFLSITVVESGGIESQENVIIKSEVEGQCTVVSLVPEGSVVKEGDLLIELDVSRFEEQRLQQEITLLNAEAALVQAKESLAITRNQAQADLASAQLDLKFARMDLQKYEEGEYPIDKQVAQAEISLAEEELSKAEDQVAWSRKLESEGFITRSELQADQLALNRQQISVDTAKANYDLLRTYTYTQTVERLQSDVEQAVLALDRTERAAKAKIIKDEAELRAKDASYTTQKTQMDHILDQIAKCRITAPASGLVVYATTGHSRYGRSREPLEVGQDVSHRQELMRLPTATAMRAQVRIKESSLPKLQLGQAAVVTVDALPGVRLQGTLTRIAMLPDNTRSWLNPDLKVYNCEVDLAEGHDALRPGMSCSVEIIVQELASAIYVPLQCVLQVDGAPTAYVMQKKGPEARPLEVGLDNNRMIHIKSGLEPGEKVLLDPPLPAATRNDNGRPQKEAKKAKKPSQRGEGKGPRRDSGTASREGTHG